MHLYFDERIQGEIKRIRTIFVVFTATYMSRVVIFIVYLFADKNEKFGSFGVAIIYYVGWFCWEVIPLTLVMSYHSNKVKKRESKRPITVSD